MSNPYHIKSGPDGGQFTHGPDSAKAKETEKRHKPEYSGITTPLDPSHQHFAIYVDHGFGTRRLGNDPTATIGAKSMSDARKAWKQVGSPSQTSKFRLSKVK